MNWLVELFVGNGIGHIVVAYAVTISLGTALGKLKIGGVSLGATFVFLTGILVSHCGLCFPELLCSDSSGTPHFIEPQVLRFVQTFGLILFVYSVGLRSGKEFFSAIKNGGIKLNILATAVIVFNVALALGLYRFFNLSIFTVVGILSGAVTCTPGLGAAQAVCRSIGADENAVAVGYAAAYPMAVLGIIFTLICIRIIFHIDLDKEEIRAQEQNLSNKTSSNQEPIPKRVPMIQIFVGILLGVLLGSFPINIPGIEQPLKLGLAGGCLIVSLLMSAYGDKVKFPTRISRNMLTFMSDMGNSLFLASVGLTVGETFISVLMSVGLLWVWLGLVVTIVPLLTIGCIARRFFKINYFTLMGALSGSMTSSSALSYSLGARNNPLISLGYATVYPLVMFERILSVQLLLLIFGA